MPAAALRLALALALGALAAPAAAQRAGPAEAALLRVLNADVSQRATGALAMLGVTVVPSETASTLAFDVGERTEFRASQLGGAFTVSDSVPIYLEGFLGVSRYDPSFFISDGADEFRLPAKWTTIGATGGVGWDLPLTDEWVLRPIANVSLGHVESDASLIGRLLARRFDVELDFLEDGNLTAGGLGGSVMLAFARSRPDYEADLQLRYTHIHLEPIAGDRAIEASSEAATLGLWSRLRTPTPFRAFGGPIRVVSEFAASWLPGDQGAVLREEVLGQIGFGVELDVANSGLPLVTRSRLVARTAFGERLRGFSVGLAVSF